MTAEATETKLYYILKWRKKQQPFPKYEVRPMPHDVGGDQEIVESNLTFQEADRKRKALEEEDNRGTATS